MKQINPNWEVSVHDVKQSFDRGEPLLLLDVREADEFALCRIPGAELVPLSELQNRIEDVRRMSVGRIVVTQCHHGGRSLNAAVALRQAGIPEVKSMAGGIDAWSTMIDPEVPRY